MFYKVGNRFKKSHLLRVIAIKLQVRDLKLCSDLESFVFFGA